MKKLFFFITLLLLQFFSFSQINYSGAYGSGSPSKDEQNKGSFKSLVFLKMEGNKYRFWLDVNIGAPSYNSGETDGTVTFVNDTASFDNTFEGAIDPCILKFKITNNTIHISNTSNSFNCGFGNGVYAEGDYPKIKNQPVLNNTWLKKEYHEAYMITTMDNKAEIFQDENCLHGFTPKQYFEKGNQLPAITETEKSIYTEYISSPGKLTYGWIKKTAVKKVTN